MGNLVAIVGRPNVATVRISGRNSAPKRWSLYHVPELWKGVRSGIESERKVNFQNLMQ